MQTCKKTEHTFAALQLLSTHSDHFLNYLNNVNNNVI